MSKQTINIGASPNDGTGTPLRTSFDYTNQNFTELYTALGGGVGLPGATTQVIFNDGGTNLAGDAGLVYNKTTDALTVAGLVTAGSATITGDLTVDTNVLKVDTTNNRVSINTTTFATDSAFAVKTTAGKFDVRAAGSLSVKLNSDQSMLYNVPTGNVHLFQINDADAMTLNSTGLGIGASPSTRLHISNTGDVYARIATTSVAKAGVQLSANGSLRSVLLYDDNAGTTYLSSGATFGGSAQALTLQSGTSFQVYTNNQLATAQMTVDTSGNVGIGVTPSAWRSTQRALQVGAVGSLFSSTTSTGSTYIGRNFYESTAGNFTYIVNDEATAYEQTADGKHIWYNAAAGTGTITFTQAMTLDASGNLTVAGAYVRAAGRTQIGGGYIGDISGTGNNRGIFFDSSGLLSTDGFGNPSDNTYDLGSATYRWDTVFAGTALINTSDRNEKQDISDLSASEKRVASSIKQLVKKYRFKDAVASKGENARIHVGWIAQDIQSAFAAEGLDASDYGMFCSDTWEENGVEKTRLGLRYDEVLAFVVSAI